MTLLRNPNKAKIIITASGISGIQRIHPFSARVILPLSVVAAQSAGLDVAVDPAQMRFAPPLAVDANSLYFTRPVHDLEVENAGTGTESAFLSSQNYFFNSRIWDTSRKPKS